MASPTNGKPSPRKRSPLPVILLLALVAAAITFVFLRRPAKPTDATPTAVTPTAAPQPEVSTARVLPKNHIYSTTDDPRQEIANGLAQARREHKRVLLDFGGDWCGDCQVLDLYFHQAPNADLLTQNFVLVHVYIGEHIDQNLDLGEKYQVPLKKGVPALAVLDANGKVLYSQTTGEFENMRNMNPASVTEFLTRWKA